VRFQEKRWGELGNIVLFVDEPDYDPYPGSAFQDPLHREGEK
jgi:hypothetical protein